MRVGAVDGLDVPAQRQHVAPVAVGMEQCLQQAVVGLRPAPPRTAPSQFSAATEISSVLSSMCASRHQPSSRRFPCPQSLYPFADRRRKGVRGDSFIRAKRQDMTLIRRNAAVEGVEIDLLHRRRSAALDHVEPSIEHRDEARPCRAESLVDPAGSPFPGALADLVGREEPGRLGAGQFAARPATCCDG